MTTHVFKIISICLTALIVVSTVTGQLLNPGAKVRLTQSGLNYAANVAVDVMAREIRGKAIPNQSGRNNMDVGKVNWEIKNIQISEFTKPGATVTVNPNDAMTWTMTDAGIKTTGDWRYEYKVWKFRARDHGSFTITVRGASTTVSVTMGRNPLTGRPTVRTLTCACSIDNVDVQFRGGRSWLYNLFSSAIERPLKRELEKAVCEGATKAIDTSGNEELATLPVDVRLKQGVTVDCRLLNDPVMGQGYIEISTKSQATYPGDSSPIPFLAPPISSPTSTLPQRMVTAYLSQYVANTLGHVLHKHRLLRHRLTVLDISSQSAKAFLTTTCPSGTCFGTLFPAAELSYPEARIELDMETVEAPTLEITPRAAMARFKAKVDVIAKLPSGANETIINLEVSVAVGVSTTVDANKVKATVTELTPSIEVKGSLLGSLPSAKLSFLLQYAADNFVVPQLNEIGDEGFEIPNMDGVEFVRPLLTLVDGALVLSTDVRYTQPI
jgi:lipopolysaccharide-binding protein